MAEILPVEPTEELEWIANIRADRRGAFDKNRRENIDEMTRIIGGRLVDAAQAAGAVGVEINVAMYEQAAQLAEKMRANFELGAQMGMNRIREEQAAAREEFTGLHVV